MSDDPNELPDGLVRLENGSIVTVAQARAAGWANQMWELSAMMGNSPIDVLNGCFTLIKSVAYSHQDAAFHALLIESLNRLMAEVAAAGGMPAGTVLQ